MKEQILNKAYTITAESMKDAKAVEKTMISCRIFGDYIVTGGEVYKKLEPIVPIINVSILDRIKRWVRSK